MCQYRKVLHFKAKFCALYIKKSTGLKKAHQPWLLRMYFYQLCKVSHNHNVWLLISKGLGRDKRTFGISVCEYKSYSMYWKIVTNNVYVRSWWNKCYILWSKSRGCDCYWSNISPVIMTFTQNSDTFLVSPKCTITMLVSNSKCSINDQHIEINHLFCIGQIWKIKAENTHCLQDMFWRLP